MMKEIRRELEQLENANKPPVTDGRREVPGQ
jgi:hypothetical protein